MSRFILTGRTQEHKIERRNANAAFIAQRHAIVRKDMAARDAKRVAMFCNVAVFVAVFVAAVYYFTA